MKSWKLTLGYSLQGLGTTLMGVGVVPQLSGATSSKLLTGIALAGFILSALGVFFSHLFVTDQTATIVDLKSQQTTNTQNIAEQAAKNP